MIVKVIGLIVFVHIGSLDLTTYQLPKTYKDVDSCYQDVIPLMKRLDQFGMSDRLVALNGYCIEEHFTPPL